METGVYGSYQHYVRAIPGTIQRSGFTIASDSLYTTGMNAAISLIGLLLLCILCCQSC